LAPVTGSLLPAISVIVLPPFRGGETL